MARILLLAFVLTCVVLVTESKTLKKSAFSSKVKAVRDSINKKEAIETSKFNLRSGDDGAVAAAEALSKGQEALGAVLDGANKRGIATPFSKGKSTKKSYEEVFFAADFVIGVVTAFSMAPCTVGMIAFEDILSNVDWEAIDWSQTTDQDIHVHVLAFIEWWTENKCSEFFASVYTFDFYVWSVFWDDLEDTQCYSTLEKDADGTIDWLTAFQHVNSLDPEDDFKEPTDECEVFHMIGEIYLDYFFPFYFEAMPDNLLEDMFNDWDVNDYIDPYFGYNYLFGTDSPPSGPPPPQRRSDILKTLLKKKLATKY